MHSFTSSVGVRGVPDPPLWPAEPPRRRFAEAAAFGTTRLRASTPDKLYAVAKVFVLSDLSTCSDKPSDDVSSHVRTKCSRLRCPASRPHHRSVLWPGFSESRALGIDKATPPCRRFG
jgi:hypothetical protein